MIKPLVPAPVTGEGEDLVLVVEVGQVKLSLPPRLSKIVHLFNEGNQSKINGLCNQLTNGHDTNNGEVVENGFNSTVTNGFHTPSPDLSDDGSYCHRERRDYRGLVKVHKSKRKLPVLPSDPKMSIFNNIDKLGVLEAELDVKKLEVKIRRQRQKVAAEFRSLTPEQRHELVVESPYLQKQIQRAIKSRAVYRQHNSNSGTSISSGESDMTLPDDHSTIIVTTSPDQSMTSFSTTITCSTPKHDPPEPPDIYLDSTIDYEGDSTGEMTSRDSLVMSRDSLVTSRDIDLESTSPLPLPATLEEEIVSICSSTETLHFSTPITTPTIPTTQHLTSASTLLQFPDPSDSEPLKSTPSQNNLLEELPPPPDSDVITAPRDHDVTSPSSPFSFLDYEELPPYSAEDLTFVTPLKSPFSTAALELSHTPTHSHTPLDLTHTSETPRKVLSDSDVSVVSVLTTPLQGHVTTPLQSHVQGHVQGHVTKRSELCTPVHSLSVSDSQLHRKPEQRTQAYERAQSVPYGIERASEDVHENILARTYQKKEQYCSKSITDKLEQIQSKLSPRSFLNTSQDHVNTYTLSYEDDLGDIESLDNSYHDNNKLYDDVIGHVETDGSVPPAKVAVQLDFDADDFVSHMNARNEKENILSNLVVNLDQSCDKTRDMNKNGVVPAVEHEQSQNNGIGTTNEEDEEQKITAAVDNLQAMVLDDMINNYKPAHVATPPPPPPYVPCTKVEMRVPHSTEEIRDIADQVVDYFITCVNCGNLIDLNREPEEIPDYAAPFSYLSFYKLVSGQAHELFIQGASHFNLLGGNSKPPPWIREQIRAPQPPWLLKHRRATPHTLHTLKPLICEEVVTLTSSQFYSIEGILSKEVVQGDSLWQDFNKDEVAMKFRLADVLLVNLLQDTVNSFKGIANKRKSLSLSDSSSVLLSDNHILLSVNNPEQSEHEFSRSNNNISVNQFSGTRQRTLSF